jgi:hypothetical protein
MPWLPMQTNERDIKRLVTQYNVNGVRIFQNKFKGKSSRIFFCEEEEARQAIKTLHKKKPLFGVVFEVKWDKASQHR